jgi:hypothetical protein
MHAVLVMFSGQFVNNQGTERSAHAGYVETSRLEQTAQQAMNAGSEGDCVERN